MTTENAASQHAGETIPLETKRSSKRSAFTSENSEQTFNELAEVFRDNQNQIAKARKLIRTLSGDNQNPGTLWRLIESNGCSLNKNDPQEHYLKHRNQTWSIRRSNKTHVWDVDNAVEVFKLAYTVQTSEQDSQKQADAFDAFQCLLEKLLDNALELDSETWWHIIDDAADLYKTAVVRTVKLEALEAISEEIPEVLRFALCRTLPPEYALHVTDDNKSTMVSSATVLCTQCTNTVDNDDFYCRHCGSALGVE